MRKRKEFGNFFLHYPSSASKRNALLLEKFDWHFLFNIGSEENQIGQKSMLQEYCVVKNMALYTSVIVLYHDFNKGGGFLPLSHRAFSEAKYSKSSGESSTALNIY